MLAITQLTIQNTEISYFLKLLNMGLKLVSSNPQLMVSYNHYGFAITNSREYGMLCKSIICSSGPCQII